MECCGNCRWFAAETSVLTGVRYAGNVGECRRYAPRGPFTLTTRGRTTTVTAFAPVPPDDWCGEFEAKTQEPPHAS